MKLVGTVLAVMLILSQWVAAQSPGSLTGHVVDASGAAVVGASIRIQTGGSIAAETQTDANGNFEAPVPADVAREVIVNASGFASSTATVPAGTRTVAVTLQPAPVFEAVNVTSSRGDEPRSDPTATVTVITATDLQNSAPATLDDALKAVPGFTLFRRTSSRNSNPTSQGVALRGIGGTSPSRSLVLADGFPLNDAFGGWVFWDKVPQAAIDRVEVDRGGSSDLYGGDALGGVIQLLAIRPNRPMGRALFEAGTLGTGTISVFGGGRAHDWRYSGAGEWFTTTGYIPVAVKQDPGIAPRGPVDSVAGSKHQSAQAYAGYQTDTGLRVEFTANVFNEDRTNGTPLSINSTESQHGSGDVAGTLGGGLFTFYGYGGTQRYHQTFTTVNATRTAETFTRDQHVPTTYGGGTGQWLRTWGSHAIVAGGEGRYVEGKSIETPFSQGVPGTTTNAGGVDRRWSGFLQDTWQPISRLTLVAGAHGDAWTSTASLTDFTKRASAFSPRAAAAYRFTDLVSVRGAVYHGFRAPTLNEFYRNFSTGNTLTRANPDLEPERMTGGDAGLLVGNARASMRATAFWNRLDDAITAITISSTATQIVKLRANADRVSANGIELEGNLRVKTGLSLTGALGTSSTHYSGTTSLRGNRVPQVPSYNFATGLQYADRRWTGSALLRVTGPQFEDDLNAFLLRRATVVDVFGGRTMSAAASAFVAAENLFDSIYDVGRTPVLTTGLPRTIRAGIRIAFH